MSKGRFTVLFLILFSIQAFAHRENSYYLQGSINKRDITIRIDEFGDVCFARFFTATNLYDRIMEGQIGTDSIFSMYTYRWDSINNIKIKQEKLIIREVANHNWEGTWERSDKQIFNISLYPINIDSLHHPFKSTIKQYQITPYAAKRLKNAVLVTGKRLKLSNKVKAHSLIHQETGIKLFLLDEKQKKSFRVDSINMFLEYQLLSAINEQYSCVHNKGAGSYSTDYNIHYSNNKLISYTYTTTSSCYGGSNEVLVQNLTLDLTNAKKLMLEDIVWLSTNPHESLIEGEYKWYQYRYKEFGDSLLKIIINEYPQIVNDTDSCGFNKVKLWQFPDWWLTPKGVHFTPTGLNKTHCSTDWFIIPYDMLKDHGLEEFDLLPE